MPYNSSSEEQHGAVQLQSLSSQHQHSHHSKHLSSTSFPALHSSPTQHVQRLSSPLPSSAMTDVHSSAAYPLSSHDGVPMTDCAADAQQHDGGQRPHSPTHKHSLSVDTNKHSSMQTMFAPSSESQSVIPRDSTPPSSSSCAPSSSAEPVRPSSSASHSVGSSAESSPQPSYRSSLSITVTSLHSSDSGSASSSSGSDDAGQQPQAMILATPLASANEPAGGGSSTNKQEMLSSSASSSSTTTAASSSASAASAAANPAAPRYKPIRTLQNSLFGQVQLAYDGFRQCSVAVKVSHASLVNPKNPSSSSGSSAAPDAHATARSQAGVSVLEDVRREARILRLLLGSDQPALSTATIDGPSSGLSSALIEAINLPSNAVVQPGAANPLTIQQQFLDSISKGKRSIAAFYDEVEAESFHYLISEYIPGGDLFSVLTAQPAHKVNEGVARQWFYQACCAMRFLHAQSVAHLDLSLENICLDEKGAIRLIDFGLAAQHPAYNGNKKVTLPDGRVQRNASNHIKLIGDAEALNGSCDCAACTVTAETLLEEDAAIRAAVSAGVPLSKLKFLCRPVCEKVHKPGKLGYMAAELYSNHAWDCYKHDVFGLGVILYSMLTGRPPFTRPDEQADVWFRVIYSGQWLMPQVRSQAPAAIYNTLSPNALHLIDLMIKPQHMRPTIDVVLKHPFFAAAHPGNAPPVKHSAIAIGAPQSSQKDSRKAQRAGSQ